MTDHTASDFANVPASVLLRANEQCNGFEAASKDGNRPQIEDFVAELPVSSHPDLLWEFIVVDWEYRQRRGESPNIEEYLRRFSEIERKWFEQAVQKNPPPGFEAPTVIQHDPDVPPAVDHRSR